MLCLVLYPSPDLPKAALRILSNMTFLFVSLSYTAECAIVTAFITFIPKFIESQFGIPASNASIYTGKSLYSVSVTFFFLFVFTRSYHTVESDIFLSCLASQCSHCPLRAAMEDVWEPLMGDALDYVLSNKVE